MSCILIVEDEQHIADGLRFNLEAEGHETMVAPDGETALAAILGEPQKVDVVILDIMLPGKDGFAVASELRAAGHFVEPYLWVSGFMLPDSVCVEAHYFCLSLKANHWYRNGNSIFDITTYEFFNIV